MRAEKRSLAFWPFPFFLREYFDEFSKAKAAI